MKAPDRVAAAPVGSVAASLASLAHAALLIDSQGQIVADNRAARRLFGSGARGSLAGRALFDLIPDLKPGELPKLLSSRRAIRREVQGRRLDGTELIMRAGLGRVRRRGQRLLLITLGDLSRRKLLETADRDSRYGFRQLAAALPQILWSWDHAGAVEYLGPRWTDFTGVPLEAQLGKGWLQQIHPGDRALVEETVRAVLANPRTLQAEFRVRRHDGEYEWFEATIVPLRGRDRLLVRWIGTIANIHEARATRMALIAERDRFARLVSSVPGAIFAFRLTADGKTSFPVASRGLRDFVGPPAEEAARVDPATIPHVHPDDLARTRPTIIESARTLTPWDGEWRVNHPQRGEVWVESHATPTREADGSTLWYGVMIDVTRRKRAEEELARSRARLEAAVMASGIGTYIWDIGAGTLWWDDNLLRIFGRTREEVERGGIDGAQEFVHPEDRHYPNRAMVPIWEGKTDHISVEYRTNRRDGALQWVAVSGRAERDADGKVTRLVGATIDITARKRAEEAQRHSQKVEALGTLAGGIAHDFNNLLLAIAGNTRIAMSDLAPGHIAQRSLAEIEKASTRASDLVHRILAFSRQSEPRRATIDLRPTIEEALRLLRATLPAMIGINSRFAADTPRVSADSTQVHQIIMNLVTNAAHAIGEEPGTVTVEVAAVTVAQPDSRLPPALNSGPYARVRVIDTGCGMDKVTLDRIFDPFFTTKPLGQGTGLGLSVVHGIVRAHDGAIAVNSEPGSGAIFDVYLPASDEPAVQGAESEAVVTHGRGQRVMYVDDEDALVFLVTRVLQRIGYAVTGFADPGEALQAFRDHPDAFDVVVTDLSMPRMSGFALARAMLEIRPDLPVLMTSGYVRPQDREAATQLGIRDVILKPDTVEELGHALEQLFQQHRKR